MNNTEEMDMAFIAVALLGFAGIGILVCIWALICNERTYRQRTRLLQVASREAKSRIETEPLTSNAFLDPYDWLNAVSYDDHFRALMMLRDPMKSYPPQLRQLAHA